MRVIERLLDRLAPWLARYGYAIYPTEMIVFRHCYDARNLGFRGQRHPRYPHLIAYWPGLGIAGLMQRPVQRVTVPASMCGLDIGGEGRLGDLLRSRTKVFGDDVLWIEL